MIDITGVDRGALIAALHNRSRPVGMGVLHDLGRDMTVEEGTAWYNKQRYQNGDVNVDYIYGRPIKIQIRSNCVEREDLFDRDNGIGACEEVVWDLLTSPEKDKK